MDGVLKQELQQLQDSYLLLQEEYWRQKDRLMAVDIEAGQLRVASEQAQATAAQVGCRCCTSQAVGCNTNACHIHPQADCTACARLPYRSQQSWM
jgi:hypothetical protein